MHTILVRTPDQIIVVHGTFTRDDPESDVYEGTAVVAGNSYHAYIADDGCGTIEIDETEKFITDAERIKEETRQQIDSLLQNGGRWTFMVEEDEEDTVEKTTVLVDGSPVLEFDNTISATEARRYLESLEEPDTRKYENDPLDVLMCFQRDLSDDAQDFENRWN